MLCADLVIAGVVYNIAAAAAVVGAAATANRTSTAINCQQYSFIEAWHSLPAALLHPLALNFIFSAIFFFGCWCVDWQNVTSSHDFDEIEVSFFRKLHIEY